MRENDLFLFCCGIKEIQVQTGLLVRAHVSLCHDCWALRPSYIWSSTSPSGSVLKSKLTRADDEIDIALAFSWVKDVVIIDFLCCCQRGIFYFLLVSGGGWMHRVAGDDDKWRLPPPSHFHLIIRGHDPGRGLDRESGGWPTRILAVVSL